MAWLNKEEDVFTLMGRYLRVGAQKEGQGWLHFFGDGDEHADKTTSWKFHMSATTREAQEELVDLAMRYKICAFKVANDSLREHLQSADELQSGKTAVFYHTERDLDGNKIEWKKFLEEARDILATHGIGPNVQRTRAVPGFPGIFYRSERGARGESYRKREGLTIYMNELGIDTIHAYNLAQLPDILEEIGILPKNGTLVDEQLPDLQEYREDETAVTHMRQWVSRHSQDNMQLPAAAEPEGAIIRPKRERAPTESNMGPAAIVGGITLALATAAALVVGLVRSGKKEEAKVPEKRGEPDVVLVAPKQDIPKAREPHKVPEVKVPAIGNVATPEDMTKAFNKLVATERKNYRLGFYPLDDAIKASSAKTTVLNAGTDDEKISALVEESGLRRYLKDAAVASVKVEERRYKELPEASDPARKITFRNADGEPIATFTILPRWNGNQQLGERSDLLIPGSVYVAREKNIVGDESMREVRVMPGRMLSVVRSGIEDAKETFTPADVLNTGQPGMKR